MSADKLFSLLLWLSLAMFLGACQQNNNVKRDLPLLYSPDLGRKTPAALALAEPIQADRPELYSALQTFRRGDAKIWGGVASHHLLLAPLLDRWFARLQADTEEQAIDFFIILAPDHFGQYSGQAAMFANPWETSRGRLAAAPVLAQRLLQAGLPLRRYKNLKIEEHGLTALLPFLARYFPDSKVLSLILPSRNVPREFATQMIEGLGKLLASERENYFLLVSADFSHYQDVEQTVRNDAESREFFQNPSRARAWATHTDNKIGLEIWGGLCQSFSGCEFVLDIHTNAWEYTADESIRDNITSYFFAHSLR